MKILHIKSESGFCIEIPIDSENISKLESFKKDTNNQRFYPLELSVKDLEEEKVDFKQSDKEQAKAESTFTEHSAPEKHETPEPKNPIKKAKSPKK